MEHESESGVNSWGFPERNWQILGVGADFLLEGAEDGISEEKEIKILQENIMGSLSVCSARQLGVMEQIARLYVEGIVLDEPLE